MRKEYDFSKAEQGKFYRPLEELEIPIYLDKEIEKFFIKKALEKNLKIEELINGILREEIKKNELL